MPNIISIEDFSSADLDVFANLTESQLRNRLEQEKGIFIAESAKVISRALDAGYEPVSLLVERKEFAGQARELIMRCGDIPIFTADNSVLAQLTGFHLSRGVLCSMRRPQLSDIDTLCSKSRRIAVLDGLMDSTNVGAIFRSAAALNIDAVLLTPTCCDPLLRRSVRVSMGTVFQIPWTRIGKNSAEWPHPGIDLLHNYGFKTIAMALSDVALGIDNPIFMEENKLAILFGTEGNGLSSETIAACDYIACIPMSHNVDSLNVAAASAVIFWQLRSR